MDRAIYLTFCTETEHKPLPAEPPSMAALVAWCRAAGKKPATVERDLAALLLVHRVATLEDPSSDVAVIFELDSFRDYSKQAQPASPKTPVAPPSKAFLSSFREPQLDRQVVYLQRFSMASGTTR